MSIDELNPSDYNPRVELNPGDAEFDSLRRSIESFGFVEPVVWNERSGRVIGGHQRIRVAKHLGYTKLDAVVVDLDDQSEKTLTIALNKISGEWDIPKLRDLLEELDAGEIDIELTGFSQDEFEELMTSVLLDGMDDVRDDGFDPDAAVSDIKNPVTQPGDVWHLGRHRLLCGDSTKREDIQRLMGDQKAQMIFTDPPYNVNYKSDDGKAIANDNMESAKFQDFLKAAFQHAYEVTEEGGAIYIAHADSEGSNFRSAMREAGWLHKQTLIWVKNAFVLSRQDYHWQHEPILYGWKPGAAHRWYGGRKKRTVLEYPEGFSVSKQEEYHVLTFKSDLETIVLKVPDYEVVSIGADDDTTVWRFDRPIRSVEHPTMKPIPLVAHSLANSSKPGDLVLDMFLGSGSTLMAAEQTGRTCFGVEFDPVYCDVIVKRWEDFTGLKAIKQ